MKDPGTKEALGRDLRAAVPGAAQAPSRADDRVATYDGIGLQP